MALVDLQLYELYVKEDVGKCVTFKELQEWAKSKVEHINSKYSETKTSGGVIALALLNTFIKENFLLDEENQNVITKPMNRI